MRENIDTEELTCGGVWGLCFGVGFMEAGFFCVFFLIFFLGLEGGIFKKLSPNQN